MSWIDNDMRAKFFGAEASTKKRRDLTRPLRLRTSGHRYSRRGRGHGFILQHRAQLAIVHTIATFTRLGCPRSADDFTVNANGTLNLPRSCANVFSRGAVLSRRRTKLHGTPNGLAARTRETLGNRAATNTVSYLRDDEYRLHQASAFGASKAVADILVQNTGDISGMPTVCSRGVAPSPAHAGTELQVFSYFDLCRKRPTYRALGQRKQVRDTFTVSIWSKRLPNLIAPRAGEVYNIGGSRYSNCSMLEAIEMCEQISAKIKLGLRGKPIASATFTGGSAM